MEMNSEGELLSNHQRFIINVVSSYEQETLVLKFGFKETQKKLRGVIGNIRLSSSTLISLRRLSLLLVLTFNSSNYCQLLPSALVNPRQISFGKRRTTPKKGAEDTCTEGRKPYP